MKKYPFQKLLIYLLVISRLDRQKFAKLLDNYLPSIVFNSEDPFNFTQSLLQNSSVPKPILSGKYTNDSFNIFLKQQKLTNLHSVLESPGFQDIIYDSDLCRKLNGMSLSPIFRVVDIHHEFNAYNTLYIDTYLDCFASYEDIQNKHNFILTYIGDKHERNLLIRILENTSRQYLKLILNIKIQDASPLELINEALHIVKTKAQMALLSEDDAGLEKWLKLQIQISEKLHNLGAGNKSDLDELIDKLKAEPTFTDPIIYTKEQLEEKYIASNS